MKWFTVLMHKTLIMKESKECTGDINKLAVFKEKNKENLLDEQRMAKHAKQDSVEESKKPEEVEDWRVDPEFDWYQNSSHVFITFKVKKGDLRQTLECALGQERIELTNAKKTIIDLRLSNYITTAQSTHSCGLKKIELKLKKEADGHQWMSLKNTTNETPQRVAGQGQMPSITDLQNQGPQGYPSSSKKKVTQAEMDKQVKQELKDFKETDGLNDLFK